MEKRVALVLYWTTEGTTNYFWRLFAKLICTRVSSSNGIMADRKTLLYFNHCLPANYIYLRLGRQAGDEHSGHCCRLVSSLVGNVRMKDTWFVSWGHRVSLAFLSSDVQVFRDEMTLITITNSGYSSPFPGMWNKSQTLINLVSVQIVARLAPISL